ncbi:MAG: hypothetical protein KAI53_01430 [Candidatus Aenigmarchaeota archaeon]|nr:hypothetical protein [Candidatus Aenigmarchaeota archaeon]
MIACDEEENNKFCREHNKIRELLGLKTFFEDEFDLDMLYEETQALVKYCTKPSKEILTGKTNQVINAIEHVKYTAGVMRNAILLKGEFTPKNPRKPHGFDFETHFLEECRRKYAEAEKYFEKLLEISDLSDAAFEAYRLEYALQGIGKKPRKKKNVPKNKLGSGKK